MPPNAEYELAMLAHGHSLVAGVDEAGRGCWAGPVVAAAVILAPADLQHPAALAGIDDSKQLSVEQRERGYELVCARALAIGVGTVPAFLIDAFGILPATRLAMSAALLALPRWPAALLIDAVRLADLALPQEALIKGDARSLSIAAASLVAKVTRDRLMRGADLAFPGYGFAAHKGYGTAAHAAALDRYGPCALHRRTFKPLLVRQHDIL